MTSGLDLQIEIDAGDLAPPSIRLGGTDLVRFYVVGLFAIPGLFVFGPMGAIGTPANLLGLACLALWGLWVLAGRGKQPTGPNPVVRILLAFFMVMTASHAAAYLRPLTELEVNSSMRGLITLAGLTGAALVVADFPRSKADLEAVLRWIVRGAAFCATIGAVQFFLRVDPFQQISIPGLRLNHQIVGIGARSIFNRPFGTALHPIEYGVVLASALPLAIHFALYPPSHRRHPMLGWLPVAVIGLGIPLSISRSAIVALAASAGMLATSWTWRRRVNGALVGGLAVVGVWVLVPGLIGTIRSLFTGLESDPSITARTDRIPRVRALFSEHPWFGRGFETYNSEDYFLLDNQLYVSAIEVGLVGLLLIGALLATSVVAARHGGRHLPGDASTHLGAAVAAGIVGLTVAIPTFDAFFYPIYMGLLFLLMGSGGCLWRLSRPASA